MRKIDAMKQVIADNGGIANWQIIYSEIEKYKPDAKRSADWQAGLRGVLYRDMEMVGIKKVDTGLFALNEYDTRRLISDAGG
ncbi:MAG: hypothetical protein RR403_05430, partial [Pseudoflavonifractor sp.]